MSAQSIADAVAKFTQSYLVRLQDVQAQFAQHMESTRSAVSHFHEEARAKGIYILPERLECACRIELRYIGSWVLLVKKCGHQRY